MPYHEARELHRQGKLKEALDRALDAYRIASTPVTALEAGQLLVEAGELVEARDIARAVALFPPSPRESEKGRDARQEAATLAGTLDARIPKVAIAGRPAGVEVLLDGKAFAGNDPTAWQGLDPGAHAIVVRAGERACTTINVTLAEGEARTIDLHDVAASCRVATPGPSDIAPAPAPMTPIPVSPPRSEPPRPAESDGHASGWRWAGVAIGGAGVIAIGVGGGVALAAKSSYESVAAECPARGCTTAAYGVRENARSQADAATVTMIAGAAALAGGVLLFVLAPHGHAGAQIGLGPGSVRVSVAFE